MIKNSKFVRNVCIFTIVILSSAVMLNPKQGSFHHWFMESARWKMTDKVMVSEIEDSVKSDVYDNKTNVRRNSYIIFSVFTVHSETAKSYRFLGILGRFIQLH